MKVSRVARRQVHLDFHTSEHVRAVGDAFDGELFARQMKASKVQSVNVFAKCHHGFAYYPSTVGTQHPHLSRDLLGEQIAALHDAGISAPIYVSIMWDDLAAAEHPEWATLDVEGRPIARPPFGAHSPLLGQRGWSTLDVATRYSEYVLQMIEELCATYAVDGFWFDILWPEPNYSQAGLTRARRAGVDDPTDAEAMYAFARGEMVAFMDSTSSLVQRLAPDSTIFYNGSVDAASRDLAPFATQLEIENLPTSGQWGYLHYPTTSRYVWHVGASHRGHDGSIPSIVVGLRGAEEEQPAEVRSRNDPLRRLSRLDRRSTPSERAPGASRLQDHRGDLRAGGTSRALARRRRSAGRDRSAVHTPSRGPRCSSSK